MELRFADGRRKEIPFLQLPISKLPRDFFPLTCRTCVDYTNVLRATGANAVIVWLSLLTCLAMFAVLCVYTYQQQPAALVALVLIAAASFAGEWFYRRWTGRTLKDRA